MTKKTKYIIAAAAALLCLLVFITAVLPIVVKNKAISTIQQATGRTTHIESVSINPFTLGIAIRGFKIASKEEVPLISVVSLQTSLSLASIYRRALILSEVTIDTPSLNILRKSPNVYDFTDIVERLQANKKPETGKKSDTHFSINNIIIKNGSLNFTDQAVAGGAQHTVRQLELSVPFISNIPYMVEKYVDPKLSAVINGAPFSFNGKLKPLHKSMETEVSIDLKSLELPELAAYLPQRPAADLASGTLTTATVIRYRVSADKTPELHLKGVIKTDNILVNLRNGSPLLKLPLLEINASDLEPMIKKFEFEKITLKGLELFASRNGQGKWMYQSLLGETPTADSKPTDATTAGENAGPQIAVRAVEIRNGAIHFSDAVPKEGFKTSLSGIDLSLKQFTTADLTPAIYNLSFLIDDKASFKSDGSFTLTPLTVNSSSELAGLELQKGWPYLADLLTAPVKGTLDVAADVAFDKTNGLTAQNGSLKIKNFLTRYGQKEGLDLALLSVDGAAFNQKKNSLVADEVRLSKGNFSLSRGKDGTLSLLSLLRQKKISPAPGTVSTQKPEPAVQAKLAATTKKQANPDLSYQVKRFQMDKFNLFFADKLNSGSPKFSLRNTNLTLTNLNGPRFTPAQLRFSSIFGKNSPLKASGQITPLPFRYKGDLSVGHLQIRDFEDYFPNNLNVFIIGGYLDSSLKLDVALKDGKPVGSFKGNSGIRAFHSIDTIAEEDLLKWESLQLDEFQGTLEPFSLAIRQIALNDIYSRIIIRKDGTLNLQNLVQEPAGNGVAENVIKAEQEKSGGIERKPQLTAAAEPNQSAVVQPALTSTTPPKKQITIGTITVQEGTVVFTDNHLPQQFTTTFFNLGGRVSGLSSEETRFAEVDLRGNLENHSPLQITGTINPLREDLFVDLKVAFRDIELSPVTPYSGTYLGYAVEKGKLYLDLKYHIEKKELNSANKIFIDQFTFGNRVESDKATSLPVRLGLALLKDRKGEIHLDVPVTGRTDDPKFSVWRLVFQVLRNLLVKAATSPFSLLSSMFGDGADLSTIQFTAGSSTLLPQEEAKLVALAKALGDRPALKMELKGFVEREKDAEGYRIELLDRKIKSEKFLTRAKEQKNMKGETIENTQLTPEEISTYLKAVYKKEQFPKPRNALGFVKGLPDNEMRKLIIANTLIGENEFKSLARERSMAVMNHLVQKGAIPATRIFLKNEDVFKAPEKEAGSRSRVELNIIAQ